MMGVAYDLDLDLRIMMNMRMSRCSVGQAGCRNETRVKDCVDKLKRSGWLSAA